jgi:ATP/ADP translocase
MELRADRLIIALILAVVFIVVAMVLLPTVFKETASATSNTTLNGNPYVSPSLGLVSLVPILFVVGVVVAIIVLMLGSSRSE